MLPDDRLWGTGHITGMNLSAILRRIEQRLDALNISADAAAQKAGKPDAIRNLKRAIKTGREGVTTGTLAALAKALETREPWLLFEIGPDSDAPTAMQIPVWGRAGAGGVVHSFEVNDPIGTIERPLGATSAQGAVEITGDSLGKAFNGWYAICAEVRVPPTDDLHGKLCVLETDAGRVFIKKLLKGRGKNFTLVANVGRTRSAPVKWAALVTDMVPR